MATTLKTPGADETIPGTTPSRTPKSKQAVSGKGYAHALSFRLTADQYCRLRRYVAKVEDKTGQRTTHQAFIEGALARGSRAVDLQPESQQYVT